MTSQSTNRASSDFAGGWMDRENEYDRRLRPDILRVSPDRNVQLMKLRREHMERRLDELRIRGRHPRMAPYARTFNGQSKDRSLATACQFAERMGWQLTRETFTDCLDATAAEDRDGWQRIRQHVRSGFADGVVVLDRAAISPQLDEYEAELHWFAAHGGFIALVNAENMVPR